MRANDFKARLGSFSLLDGYDTQTVEKRVKLIVQNELFNIQTLVKLNVTNFFNISKTQGKQSST